MNNADLIVRDLSVLWHPCTQMKDHETFPPVPIRRAEGVWLEDHDGKRYLDAISSWWVNLFGHNHPHIVEAIRDQMTRVSQVILAGFTHEPVIRLSERLVALAPGGLTRVSYASDGSSAVEMALKMSFHTWRNCGERRHRFLTLSGSYHGETIGALSVGDVPLYRETYRPLLLEPIVVPSPDCYSRDTSESCEAYTHRQFAHMEAALARHAHETCAVIVEPLVQCAAGMRMYHPVYLSLLREACTRHGVHLIADEIATGFGRTGTLFACEQAGITPDILCVGKGLTGGFLPLSACLATDAIYQAFYADPAAQRAFLHSHSYTGNALACAAANATLDLFEREPVLVQNQERARQMRAAVASLAGHPQVAEIRQTGMILAIELVQDKKTRTPFPAAERRGRRVHQAALAAGVLLRPLGDVVYFMPPYVISPEEIAQMGEVTCGAIGA